MTHHPGDAASQPPAHPPHPPHPAEHVRITLERRSPLLQAGGGLGIAGFSIGLAIFLVSCFGFGASLYLAWLPLVMGAVGLGLTVAGGIRDPHAEGPAVVAGLFLGVASIVGGLLGLAALYDWRIFA